ncbi:XdhC family protein [Halobacteriovorax sp.]|uniref:XdhC family protein n=1 Tax=Halobacteriovorax sp. TaxID=2020862 RepID=UPI003562295A
MIQEISRLDSEGICFCVATLVDTKGSAPQDRGARIIVFPDGKFEGTIGGGKLENFTLKRSLELLSLDEVKNVEYCSVNLQKDIGMTCGGVASIYFEVFNRNPWNITVFGAGHVSQSLCRFLVKLNCNLTIVDNRKEWLDRFDDLDGVKVIHLENMSDHVKSIPCNSFVVLMTMGHSKDVPILNEILSQEIKYPYLGVIGSIAKRNSMEKELREKGVENFDFICPLGANIGDNSPPEISISIIAQLLEYKDNFFKTQKRK